MCCNAENKPLENLPLKARVSLQFCASWTYRMAMVFHCARTYIWWLNIDIEINGWYLRKVTAAVLCRIMWPSKMLIRFISELKPFALMSLQFPCIWSAVLWRFAVRFTVCACGIRGEFWFLLDVKCSLWYLPHIKMWKVYFYCNNNYSPDLNSLKTGKQR